MQVRSKWMACRFGNHPSGCRAWALVPAHPKTPDSTSTLPSHSLSRVPQRKLQFAAGVTTNRRALSGGKNKICAVLGGTLNQVLGTWTAMN